MTPTALLQNHAPARTTGVPHSVGDAARQLFDALGELHCLPVTDRDLVARAAAGLRFIRSAGEHLELDRALFRVALVDLGDEDAWVVESAARYAAEHVAPAGPDVSRPASRRAQQRALWLTAILRVADGVCSGRSVPSGCYAVWTDSALFVEFDGAGVGEAQVEIARGRVAALELLAGRRAILTCSRARRGAA